MAPHTPSKALGAAFQNINIAPQQHTPLASQYQPQRNQPAARTPFSTFVERPAHEQLANVLSKALPIQPNNPEGLATYNNQVANWHATYGQNGKGPSKTRPYPLTPGSAPVASGKCWTCGYCSHHPRPCSQPAVPTFKAKWRLIAQTIRKRAEVAAAAATNVNIVALESAKIQMYDANELAHLQQLANQGKQMGRQCRADGSIDGPGAQRARQHNSP
ncbi:hypothetical protein BYT27DRAFT_7099848 [Phlegmacium glaucopus]|nr:hypothetical protein BYT27DRAFT_7099848 [Phlegmacium glaucopus]